MIDFTKTKSIKAELEKQEQAEFKKQRKQLLFIDFLIPVFILILTYLSQNLIWWGLLSSLFAINLLRISGKLKDKNYQPVEVLEILALLLNAGLFVVFVMFIFFRFIFKI